MGNLCCKRRLKKCIVLLLVGLDNAGKTATAKGLAGEPVETVVPTIGFSVINLQYAEFKVKIFDLGGRQDIRGIWDRYFVDAHGIIFVVDSSDYSRLEEAHAVFKDLITHEKIMGKPILILANKQDSDDALDEIDLVEKLQIEILVNQSQCPAMVESCSTITDSATKNPDQGIMTGYRWLLNYIIKEYRTLNERVKNDVEIQEKINHQNRLKIIERLKKMKTVDDNDECRVITVKTPPEATPQSSIGQFLVDTKEEQKNNSDMSIQSDTSFPHIYNENLEDLQQRQTTERPKSAVDAVRQQLLNNAPGSKTNLRLFSGRTNKTSPAIIFDVPRPASASSSIGSRSKGTLPQKSAGDSINNVSNVEVHSHGPNGDASNGELYILTELNRHNQTTRYKLPPINNIPKNKDAATSSKRNNTNQISIIEIN